MLAAVKAGDIFEVIWVSLVAGVIVSTTFSFVVLGMARSTEAARRGQRRPAIAYAGARRRWPSRVFAAAVVLGVHVMLSKG